MTFLVNSSMFWRFILFFLSLRLSLIYPLGCGLFSKKNVFQFGFSLGFSTFMCLFWILVHISIEVLN